MSRAASVRRSGNSVWCELRSVAHRDYRQARGKVRRSPQTNIFCGDLRIVLCDLVFIGLSPTLCYFASYELEMQDNLLGEREVFEVEGDGS
jgi:hypothetical protein